MLPIIGNPTQSIESSVQIPTMKTRIGHFKNKTTDNQIFKPQSCLPSTINYGMRDLYHRKAKKGIVGSTRN
jgi:hypothetical protein